MSEILDLSKSQLINSDCLEALKSIPDSSIDCIITDPPYNLGLFMHKRGTNLKKMRDNQFAFAGWDNMKRIGTGEEMDELKIRRMFS